MLHIDLGGECAQENCTGNDEKEFLRNKYIAVDGTRVQLFVSRVYELGNVL